MLRNSFPVFEGSERCCIRVSKTSKSFQLQFRRRHNFACAVHRRISIFVKIYLFDFRFFKSHRHKRKHLYLST